MKCSIAILAAITGTAYASPYLSNTHELQYLDMSTAGGSPYDTIDISGFNSWDGLGDPDNEVAQLQVAFGGAHIIGLSWEIYVSTVNSSWLSEANINIEDEIYLAPGVDDTFPGTGSYTSGGMIDLLALGLDFFVSSDGMLDFELFESFDDENGAIDAVYGQGSTLSVVYFLTPPTPGALAPLAISGFFVSRRRR